MSSDPNINKILGMRLRKIRNEKDLTREMLSEKIDVSSRFLADVESGKVGISLITLKNICEVLNVSADYMIGLSCENNSEELSNIETTIKRIDPKHLPYLAEIISSFYSATKHTKKE